MILPVVALVLQAQAPIAPPPPADRRPVHIWIDSPSPLFRGVPVRVYVQLATSGNLVVLHRRTDGRIEPLFPATPKADAWVHAGEYEIRSPGDRPAFVLAEPDGGGMILAALSAGPIWFDEFAHAASWDAGALVPSWTGADAEGALTDIVQRMLGDGTFNYDILSYTVRPAAYAQQPQPAPSSSLQPQDTIAYAPPQQDLPVPQTCVDCTFIGTQIVEAPLFISSGRGFRHRRFEDRKPPCPALTICGEPAEQLIARVIPTAGRTLGQPGVPPRVPRTFTTPRHAATVEAAQPRPREPAATSAAEPLVPGRPVGRTAGERPPLATPASRSALALRYVRARPVAMATATPVTAEAAPREPAAGPAAVTGPTTIVTPASLRHGGAAVGFRMPAVEQPGVQTFARPRAGTTAPATGGADPQPRASSGTIAFPMAAWHGGAVRTGAVSSATVRTNGGRRR